MLSIAVKFSELEEVRCKTKHGLKQLVITQSPKTSTQCAKQNQKTSRSLSPLVSSFPIDEGSDNDCGNWDKNHLSAKLKA
jgi:hypothetical protein